MQLRAPDLDDAGEFLFLGLKRGLQRGNGFLQPVQSVDRGNLQCRREDVVGRLVQIDVMQRMHPLILAAPPTEDFLGAVGNHLVDVHVERGAGAALQGIDDHRLAVPPVSQFFTCLADGLRQPGIEIAQRRIGPGTGQLDLRHAANQPRMTRLPR